MDGNAVFNRMMWMYHNLFKEFPLKKMQQNLSVLPVKLELEEAFNILFI